MPKRLSSAWALLCAAIPIAAMADTGPLAPNDALTAFQHDSAVRIELVASEPLVFDPIALCFDADGRLFVVENRGYPADAEPPRGDIVLLEDTDRDGAMDRRTVFADGFDFPSGIMPWKGGLLVACSPDVLHLKDIDGDGRADTRERLLTGFSTGGSTQLRTSHPTLGMDGWIYFTNGLSGGEVHVPGAPPEGAVKMGAMDLRWHPWSNAIEAVTGQAQYGQAFDHLGNRFICSNRKHLEQVMLQPGDTARNPHLPPPALTADVPDHGQAARLFPLSSNVTTAYSHTGTFTAACGLVIYRGAALGPAFHGNAFVCDPTGNLVHRDVLDYTATACAARRAYGDREFLASPDNWFRPVFLANGPDGALYLCDMYRKTIEHPVYLPPEVAAKTDFTSGRDRGRIYRIVAKDAPPPVPPQPVTRATALVDLASEEAWRADTAYRLLVEDAEAVPALRLRGWLAAAPGPGRDRALHALHVRGALQWDDVAQALASDYLPLRLAALRLAPAFPLELKAARLRPLLRDASPQVRFHAALAAGLLPGRGVHSRQSGILPVDGMGGALAECLLANTGDPWLVAACLLSGAPDVESFTQHLARALPVSPQRNDAVYLDITAKVFHLAGAAGVPGIADVATGAASASLDPWTLRALNALLEGRRKRPAGPIGSPFDQLAQAGADPRRLARLLAQARAAAIDVNAAEDLRAGAIALFGHTSYPEARDVLATALTAGVPAPVQRAAVRAIAALATPEATALLLAPGAWPALTGDARTAAKAVVLARPDGARALLEAIERGEFSPYTLAPDERTRLMQQPDPALAALAQRVFAALGGADRQQVYEDHKDLLQLIPDPASGRAVFAENCAQCHVFQGQGHAVGPDLSDIRAQTPEYILLHVLVPNQAVTAGYESTTIATTGLETYTGVLAAQNAAAVTLRQALGVEQTVPRTEITALTTENRSLMPDELEKTLSRQQLRDLIAFLKGE